MKNVANTIEDLLEILAGLQGQAKIQIESSDATIMYSIARQVFKGTALTDRQFALMKEKLQTYRNQFTALDYDFDTAVETLRQPLRYIDRSKYIKIVDFPEDIIVESKCDDKFIEIRFPFKKTDIMLINEIVSKNEYHHKKGSHKHFFVFNENNIYNILSRFSTKEYEIDSKLTDLYKEICKIRDENVNYLPCIKDKKIYNFSSYTNNNDYIRLVDRHRRYGLVNLDSTSSNNLVDKIAFRKTINYHSKPSCETTDSLLESLHSLDRYPLLVLLESTISTQKLPKILLNADWKPIAALSFNSHMNRYVERYIEDCCDLIIHREETISPFRRYVSGIV